MTFTDEQLRDLNISRDHMDDLTRVNARILIAQAIKKVMEEKWTVTRLSTGEVVGTYDSYAKADDVAWGLGKGGHSITHPRRKVV